MEDTFDGFPKECLAFYRGLERNNTKQWFEEHRFSMGERTFMNGSLP